MVLSSYNISSLGSNSAGIIGGVVGGVMAVVIIIAIVVLVTVIILLVLIGARGRHYYDKQSSVGLIYVTIAIAWSLKMCEFINSCH